MRSLLLMLSLIAMSSAVFAQTPPIEPGVSQELARWRTARYSDVRYKLNLTLEKMSPVLKGTMEIRVNHVAMAETEPQPKFIVLDWRKIRGSEKLSTISNVSLNGTTVVLNPDQSWPNSSAGFGETPRDYQELNEHLVFRNGVRYGENVIKLDFTSPILTSGSAITRYIDKEDGSEYIYSLFVPSEASTAFPVFDQPDLKARFSLHVQAPESWGVIGNTASTQFSVARSATWETDLCPMTGCPPGYKPPEPPHSFGFETTSPISTYVFAFAAGPFLRFGETAGNLSGGEGFPSWAGSPVIVTSRDGRVFDSNIYVRKSQAAKFKPHAAEVFRLNREAVKYFEHYFDYKFPFPKYDLVLIPEFPFGGMEHAGATFLRESAVIFPQEPTRNDLVSRATLIFHEAAHQWFGDTVTMRWFDDLWLKEGFATFTAYKAMEKIMPEMNAWKVFYERIKQGAYQTDSTRGTTAIYQPIANLSAAKSAYGNIVYYKAPAFLRQAEFFLGEEKFQAAVRAFLKKHEFGNAGWEDLVKEFENAAGDDPKKEFAKVTDQSLSQWAKTWVEQRGLGLFRVNKNRDSGFFIDQSSPLGEFGSSHLKFQILLRFKGGAQEVENAWMFQEARSVLPYMYMGGRDIDFVFPNYGDYGYGIFLLDEKSRDYVLKNIRREKDPFLRTMMWGSLWDSVREGEMDPRVFVELVVKNLTTPSAEAASTPPNTGGEFKRSTTPSSAKNAAAATPPNQGGESEDESTIATLLGRTGTALNYYMSVPPAVAGGALAAGAKTPPATAGGTDKTGDLRTRVEEMLIERMRNAPSLGQRITFYRALLNIASSDKARGVLKELLATGGNLSGSVSSPHVSKGSALSTGRVEPSLTVGLLTLRTKDKFDIITRLLILNDPDAPRLLAELEKAETSDDAKRYAYAAKAGIGTAENKAKYWKDFTENKEIFESWIEAAFGPWNSIRHSEMTLPYLERALKELPNHKRDRKIFFVNGWLGAFIGGQRSAEALAIVNKFLGENPGLDNDLRLKVLENADLIERAVRIRGRY